MQDFFPSIHPFEAADLISYPNGLVVGHYNPIPGQLQGQVALPATTPVVTVSGCKLTAPALCSFPVSGLGDCLFSLLDNSIQFFKYLVMFVRQAFLPVARIITLSFNFYQSRLCYKYINVNVIFKLFM